MKAPRETKTTTQAQPPFREQVRHFRARLIAAALAATVAMPWCAAADASLQAIAGRVAQGVGVVVKTTPTHKSGPVFVFEEYHNSRAGQIQVATMLTRLYQQQGLRVVGLEGAVKGPAPLPTEKYLREVEGPTRSAVLKDLLRDAEISGVEYSGAVLPGLQVVGIENADEYNVRPPDESGGSELMAILAIAERTLKPDQLKEIVAKLKQDKVQDAIEVMKAADPWIKARLDAMKNPDLLKLPDLAANAQAILDKAKSLQIELPPEVERGLQGSIKFYRTADKRSDTMAAAMADLAKQNAGKPLAMIIGAAHTDRVLAELERRDVTAVVLRAESFKGEQDKSGTRSFELKSQGLWANDEKGSLGAILNVPKAPSGGQRKPPPVVGDVKREGYASAQAAAKIAAKAVRDGGDFPRSIIERVQALPGITVDPSSLERIGYDVIFAFTTDDTSGKKQKVWVRAGTRPVGAKSSDSVEAAMAELRKAEVEAGVGNGGGKEPPDGDKKLAAGESGEKKGEKGEGKDKGGEGKNQKGSGLGGEEAIGMLVNREVQAKFFRSAEEARSYPPISQ